MLQFNQCQIYLLLLLLLLDPQQRFCVLYFCLIIPQLWHSCIEWHRIEPF